MSEINLLDKDKMKKPFSRTNDEKKLVKALTDKTHKGGIHPSRSTSGTTSPTPTDIAPDTMPDFYNETYSTGKKYVDNGEEGINAYINMVKLYIDKLEKEKGI